MQSSALEHLVQAIDPRASLRSTWPLRGGISAKITGIEYVLRGGETRRVVLRMPAAEMLRRNPRAAADEFRLLQRLRAAGLQVPTPIRLDESGEIFAEPYLVVGFIDGAPEFSPTQRSDFVAQMAMRLAEIHRVAANEVELLPTFIPAHLRQRDYVATSRTVDVAAILAVLENASPPRALNQPVLLHGDFWPGNVVWNAGRISAVIDWEEACIGDPIVDVAIARLDILWLLGIEWMHEFTQCYRALLRLDFRDLPYWDLDAALRPAFNIADWASQWPDLGRPDITETTMRSGHAQFVAQALAALHL